MLFSSSDFGSIATLFPPEGGYASILHGKVVDMFYFPLLSGTFPEWLPIWGGEHFLFFRPVFNIADASITSGVIVWILFQKKIYPEENKTSTDELENSTDNTIVENN
jgi:signal peptidase II